MTVKELYTKAFEEDKYPSEIGFLKGNERLGAHYDYHYLRGSYHFTTMGTKSERLCFFDDPILSTRV